MDDEYTFTPGVTADAPEFGIQSAFSGYGELTPEQMAEPSALRSMRERGMKDYEEEVAFSKASQAKRVLNNQDKQAAIQRGLDAILAQQPNYAATLLAMGSGFLKPTRTGNFFESLGNAGSASIDPLLKEQSRTDARKLKELDYRLTGLGLEGQSIDSQDRAALERAKLGRALVGDAARLRQLEFNLLSRQSGAKATAEHRANMLNKPTDVMRNARELFPNDPDKQRAYIERVTTQAKDKPAVDHSALSPEGKKAVDSGFTPGTPEFAAEVKRLVEKNEVSSEKPEDRIKGSYALGVPLLDVDPYGALPPKYAATARQQAILAGQKEINADADKALDMTNMAEDLKRFKLLNQRVDSGPMYREGIATWFGSDPAREMVKISDRLTPLMRQGLPGAASDRDVQMFRNATVSITTSRTVNDNIAQAAITKAENFQQKSLFKEAYLQANGSLQGAEQQWKKYLEANPIFDHKAPEGSYKLNAKRETWQDYFRKGHKGAPKGPASSAPTLQELEAEAASRGL